MEDEMAGGPRRPIPLSQDEVRALFVYDAGVLRYRTRPHIRSAIRVGDIAGRLGDGNRCRISVAKRPILRSHLVWLYCNGSIGQCEIDHINRDPADDRIENLRLATRSEQNANRGVMRNNTSGHRAIYYDARKKLWSARVSFHGRRRRLGMYATAEEAADVADQAGREAYGEFWKS